MTALTHMAAARPPGIADARVPCPLCGGLIHPVAGRCKHCKEDLSSYRAGRPQAAVALPALDRKSGAASGPHDGMPNGAATTNGHALATANALVQSFAPPAQTAQQPILPPRTTSRSVQAQRPHSMWRSWPMLVIVVAAIAIVAATVIMVMPQDGDKKRGTISTPPAPERMQTNPLPDNQQGSLDPWAQPGTVPQVPDPVMPDPPAPAPQDPNDDIWGGLGAVPPSGGHGGPPSARGGGGGLGNLYGGAGSDVMVHAFHRVCTKIKSCPDVEESFTLMCDMIPKPSSPPTCAALNKCLDNIDKLDCSSSQSASPHVVVYMLNECIAAAQQC
jgi:hypothetical protein